MFDESTNKASIVPPKITLITPVFNAAKYLESTIQSVISQEYSNLEWILVDGGSTDGSLDIIHKYQNYFSSWVSEPDRNMYDALNKGFNRSTGTIMGWISGTDMLHVGSLHVVASVFNQLSEVDWIMGRATGFTDKGMCTDIREPKYFSYVRFILGHNKWIQQESTFWRRSLWERAGERLDSRQSVGADFELWVRFFELGSKLYPVNALIGGYRDHQDSGGRLEWDKIVAYHSKVVNNAIANYQGSYFIKYCLRVDSKIKQIKFIREHWIRFTIWILGGFWAKDLPSLIEWKGEGWGMRETKFPTLRNVLFILDSASRTVFSIIKKPFI